MKNALSLIMSIILMKSGLTELNLTQMVYSAQNQPSITADVNITDDVSLVNKQYMLKAAEVPADLTDLVGRVPCTKSEVYMVKNAADALVAMVNAMKEDGITDIYAVSGYRSYSYQKTLFENRVAVNQASMTYAQAYAEAASIIAPPGSSEHQTGLAVDLSTKASGFALDSQFAQTPAGKWLYQNCQKYGFILRYAKEKQEFTSIVFEPWHFRYVGKPHAEIIMKNGLCLEEYLKGIHNGSGYKLPGEGDSEYVVTAMAKPDYTAEGLSQLSTDGMGGYIATSLVKSKTEQPELPILIPIGTSVLLYLSMVDTY